MDSINRLDLYNTTLNVLYNPSLISKVKKMVSDMLINKCITSVEVVSTYEITLYETLLETDVSDNFELIAMIKTLFRYTEDFIELKDYISDGVESAFLLADLVHIVDDSDGYDKICTAFKQIAISGMNLTDGKDVSDYAKLFPPHQREYALSLLSGYYNLVTARVKAFSFKPVTRMLFDDEFIRVLSAYGMYLAVESVHDIAVECASDLSKVNLNTLKLSTFRYHKFFIKCFEDKARLKSVKINVRLQGMNNYEASLVKSLGFIKKLIKENSVYVPPRKIVVEPDKGLDSPIKVSRPVTQSIEKLSDKEKIEKVLSMNILVLASSRVNLSNLRLRVENIQTVSEEVLRQPYDGVFVITKFIGHKHTYRVKSVCKSVGNDVYLISATNNKKLLVGIYDNLFGRGDN